MKKFIVFTFVGILAVGVNANSPYIAKVYDFLPAPGQFVNKLPEYNDGDTSEDMLKKVEEQLCGDSNPGMISLGSYGGYVVFGFDHPVVNVPGAYDFKIYGNAFKATNSSTGGSCEPGIVLVSCDTNDNGIPDDEWYELAGSEYNKSETIHNYNITYYKPDADRAINADPDPNYGYINDRTYVKWTDNQGETGYVMRNTYHSQSYYPEWIEYESLSFEGTLLADNAYDQSGNGSYYVLNSFDWGYVDNQPNDSDPGFNIDWAVDKARNSKELDTIDFIKVYSAMNQYCGWIGETSTEVCGGEDLHPYATISSIDNIKTDDNAPVEYFNLQGIKVAANALVEGIYIRKQGSKTTKIYIR